eukprot:6040596-Amphidinium_carterae.1
MTGGRESTRKARRPNGMDMGLARSSTPTASGARRLQASMQYRCPVHLCVMLARFEKANLHAAPALVTLDE